MPHLKIRIFMKRILLASIACLSLVTLHSSGAWWLGSNTLATTRPMNNIVILRPSGVNTQTTADNIAVTWTCSTIDNKGNTILAGTYQGGWGNQFVVAWITPGTNLQGTTVIIPAMDGGEAADMGGDQCLAVTTDKSGNVYLGGSSADITGQTRFAVVKINNRTKQLDPSFGESGVVRFEYCLAGGVNDKCTALTIDKQGKLVVAGTSGDDAGNTYFALARLTRNGGFDRTLGNSYAHPGTYVVKPTLAGGINDICTTVTIDSRNGILLSGTSADMNGNSFFASIRFPKNQRW